MRTAAGVLLEGENSYRGTPGHNEYPNWLYVDGNKASQEIVCMRDLSAPPQRRLKSHLGDRKSDMLKHVALCFQHHSDDRSRA